LLPDAVGCIDATSHELYVPTHNQRLYYSGHRHYHFIHTQVVTDDDLNIRHVESGFLGHNNVKDAHISAMITEIGNGSTLDFPLDLFTC